MSYTLTTRIGSAIANKNSVELLEIKRICDLLHDGSKVVDTIFNDQPVQYTVDDLPSDAIYEQFIAVLSALNVEHGVASDIAASTIKLSDNYFMGSVPKKQQIEPTSAAVLLPKYDGVSCGMTFRRTVNNMFELTTARTRGVVEAKANTTTRKYQVVTNKIVSIINNIVDALNDESKQDIAVGRSILRNVNEIIIRGEVVIKDVNTVLDGVPASIVAGKLNGGLDVWQAYISNIVVKPFEVVRVFTKNYYTITQLEALVLFNELGLNCPYALAKQLKSTENSLNYVKSLFNSRFKGFVNEPIDGVVYCAQEWMYPYNKTDNGKTDYGKYAWKPSNECTTTITSIDETRSKDGFIEFSVNYMPVIMDNKQFTKVKIVPTSIVRFGDKFGIGSVITVMLRDNIAPYIKECDIPAEGIFEPWHMPTNCNCCHQALQVITKKDTTRIQCTNDRCNATIIKLCADMIKTLKIKGCADKTIEKFFITNGIQQYSPFDLFTSQASPLTVAFITLKATITVDTFIKIAFPLLRGEKQRAEIIAELEMNDCLLHRLINHKALIEYIASNEAYSFFTRELARAFK